MTADTSFDRELAHCLLSSSARDDGGKWNGIFRFPVDFIGFQGHFNGNPVLPAVVQLAAVRWFFGRSQGIALQLEQVERAKFKRVIGPEQEVEVRVSGCEHEKKYHLSFSIHAAGGEVSSGSLICTRE